MRSIGIVRKVDELGRIVIPKETRDKLSIHIGDSLEIFYDEESIYLKKYTPGCIFCGDISDTIYYKGSCICKKCFEDLKNHSDDKTDAK